MWHIYSAGALVSCVLCALVAATWMRVTYVPHESLSSCSPLFAWLARESGSLLQDFTSVAAKQCGEHLLCVKNNAVKYKYICICIGSSASYKRGLEVSAVWEGAQENWKKNCLPAKKYVIMTIKYANLFHIPSSTMSATPYAEKNIVKANFTLQLTDTVHELLMFTVFLLLWLVSWNRVNILKATRAFVK